jgi:hypothetical protein
MEFTVILASSDWFSPFKNLDGIPSRSKRVKGQFKIDKRDEEERRLVLFWDPKPH